MKVRLISHTQDPEVLIATAARLCYSNKIDITTIQDDLSEEEIDRFIERLISSRHLTPLEHSSFSFAIEGISRACSHEIVRHRIGIAISQRSQRYCAEGECDFFYPSGYSISEKAEEIFESSLANSKQDYKDLISEDVAKEVARYVLPNATQTRMIVTMNARELLHFFALRCCSRSMDEMQRLAKLMLAEVMLVSPILFKKAGPSCVQLGYCPEGLMCCGKAPTLDQLKRRANILTNNREQHKKRVYVASAFGGDIKTNKANAIKYCQEVISQGFIPVASHLLYPQMLDNNNPDDREKGMQFGLDLIRSCDELWAFGDITHGMQREITEAEKIGIPVKKQKVT